MVLFTPFPAIYVDFDMIFIGIFLNTEGISDLITIQRISEFTKNVPPDIVIYD